MEKKKLTVNEFKLAAFIAVYSSELKKEREKNPQNFSWSVDRTDEMLNRFKTAIASNNFLKDSPSMKRTCKALGIKHTYTAIKEYISDDA